MLVKYAPKFNDSESFEDEIIILAVEEMMKNKYKFSLLLIMAIYSEQCETTKNYSFDQKMFYDVILPKYVKLVEKIEQNKYEKDKKEM